MFCLLDDSADEIKDQAVACYQDPDYQQAMKFANQAFDREMDIIDSA